MKHIHIPLALALAVILAAGLVGCGSAPLTTKIHDPSSFSSATSLAVLDFSAKDSSVKYTGNADSLGHVLATYLQKELQENSKSFAVYLGSADSAKTDLVVEGKFTTIDEGDDAARVLVGVGAGGVTVAVEGVIKGRTGIVAEFSKSKTSSGGPIGMGGILAGDTDEIIDDIMSDLAEDLAEFVLSNVTKK